MTDGLETGYRPTSVERTARVSDPVDLDAMRKRLVAFAVKLVWNRADAEELVQDAFKTAVAKGIAIESEVYRESPEDQNIAWLFRTTAQLCLNHRRRRKPEPLGDWVGIDGGQTPDARVEVSERLERMRSCIERLPDQQRLALTMRWMEQMAYDDIAQVMQISVSAVRAHVHQARRRLSELMADEVGDHHA